MRFTRSSGDALAASPPLILSGMVNASCYYGLFIAHEVGRRKGCPHHLSTVKAECCSPTTASSFVPDGVTWGIDVLVLKDKHDIVILKARANGPP